MLEAIKKTFFAAVALDFGLAIFTKLLNGAMRTFRTCHDRPLALEVREADNRIGFGSCDLNSHGLGLHEPAAGTAGQVLSKIWAHHGPFPYAYDGWGERSFLLWPLMSVGEIMGASVLLIANISFFPRLFGLRFIFMFCHFVNDAVNKFSFISNQSKEIKSAANSQSPTCSRQRNCFHGFVFIWDRRFIVYSLDFFLFPSFLIRSFPCCVG